MRAGLFAVVLSLWAAGCADETVSKADPGREGGPCYRNRTCDFGFVCSGSDLCVRELADVCGGVTCSGHGTCNGESGAPVCDCALGYHADGLACVGGCVPKRKDRIVCESGDLYWFDSCGTREELSASCCGAGCTADQCNTPAQNTSYACDDGDVYFYDACGNRGPLKQDCCDAGCEGRSCNPPLAHATTACSDGDVYWFDSCGLREERAEACAGACSDGACSGPSTCPPDMAEISMGIEKLCVDKYEATVYSAADCTGTRYGMIADDLPAGFPDAVTSAGCASTCEGTLVTAPTVDVYACSVANVRPTAYVTYFQAKRACENSGKRLCDRGEWHAACRGPLMTQWPYGNAFQSWWCNDTFRGVGATTTSGALTSCQGGFTGLWDLSGNLDEWTLCGTGVCGTRGGDFQSNTEPTSYDCYGYDVELPGNTSGRIGFRCCKGLP